MVLKKTEIIKEAEKLGFDMPAVKRHVEEALAKGQGKNVSEDSSDLALKLVEKQAEKHIMNVTEKASLIERVQTGIPGFDELCEGGIPKNSLVLLTGGTGTGKSTLAMQFLVEGALNGEAGVYISLEEAVEKSFQQMDEFGWPLEELQKKGLILVTRPELYDFEKLVEHIEESVSKIHAKRLVIDSISLISLYFKDEFKIRRSLLNLETILKKSHCTTIAISEIRESSQDISLYGVEEFIVDGIVVVYLKMMRGTYVRAITIRKMRSTNHSLKLCPFQIHRPGGIVVFPDQEIFEEF